MPDPTDPRLAAALRRLDRGITPFVDQFAPILDRIERTVPADLTRARVVNPLAEAVLAVYSGVGRSEQARFDAVQYLLDWLGAHPVAQQRRRLLLRALRRDGVPAARRARALRERLAASLVPALETALDALDAAVFRQPDVLRRALRSRLATEVSADLLDRPAKPASPLTPRAEFEAYRRAAQEVAAEHDPRRDLGTARRLLAGARLSPRERTVADLMAKGRSDAEIARRLRITERTVRVLRHRITQKLKTRGTTLH